MNDWNATIQGIPLKKIYVTIDMATKGFTLLSILIHDELIIVSDAIGSYWGMTKRFCYTFFQWGEYLVFLTNVMLIIHNLFIFLFYYFVNYSNWIQRTQEKGQQKWASSDTT